MRALASLLLALLVLTPAAAHADICDDIDTVAEGWNVIANALEETAGEDLEDLDLDRLQRDVDDLLPGTDTLGQFLIDEGNASEQDLGNDLLDAIDELYDVETDDYAAYLVDRIDDVVDVLDAIVEYCDVVSE